MQMLIKETLSKTKKLFHKSFKNLKNSLIFVKYQKHPTNPTHNPNSPDTNKDNSKLKDVDDNFYGSFSEKRDANDGSELKKKEAHISVKAQTKKDERITTRSISFADCRGSEGLKGDKNARKQYGRRSKESGFRARPDSILAQKMKDLEMMDVDDMDHVMDVEEVLHCYSRLRCPTYAGIVERFFTDMYSEFHVAQPSRSGSMRKMGSASAHSSMRSLGPLKL
ncbi:hypothetical protein OROMI_003957 [Orobanche minor]